MQVVIKRLYLGVGIMDADYPVQPLLPNGKRDRCPYYVIWTNVLSRCFSASEKLRHPTYKDVTCCEEWLTFSNFKSWMETQDWRGKHLDKDLLVAHNKIYSPETCVFIAPSINSFLLKSDKNRGDYPLGVTFQKDCDKFRSFCGVNYKGNRKHLGLFSTPMSAHKAWQKEKIKQAKTLQSEQTDPKVIKGLQRVIDKIQSDYDNNLETKDF